MLVQDFDFYLPDELIAQAPPAERAGARMLTVDRSTGLLADRQFLDLPSLLRPGDVLVVNDSRVIPARLFAERVRTQLGHEAARVEVLLTQQVDAWEWKALVRPGRKVLLGDWLHFSGAGSSSSSLVAEVVAHGEFGERTLRFTPVDDFFGALDELGHMPLPPYIHREDADSDRARYQTVYARQRGSVAAPTAGLHFTEAVLEAIRARGVTVVPITLHVGLGTFQPVRVERVDEIELHTERYTLPAPTAEAVNAALREGRRVIAAGTTTVRTLEHCARAALHMAPDPDGIVQLRPHAGETNIFLSPGSEFRVVAGLLTNFHLPRSTLLMLISAFAGHDRVMGAYRHAVEQRYRFFSYGDCMLIT